MVNTDKKLAFTLAEALVSMLILSIFIGLSMKIFTKKHTKPVYNPTHGYFICYRGLPEKGTEYPEGVVYKKVGAGTPVPQDGDYCEFTPSKSANYYVVYAVGAGGGGRPNIGGAPGDFTTLFVTNIADPLKIYPGAGGNPGQNGNPTIIRNNDPVVADSLIIEANGGLAGGETKVKQKFVRSCHVVPLAKMLKTEKGKDFLDNQSTDKASCEVTGKGFVARLCPHSAEDVRQEKQIEDFYGNYAESTASAWGVASNKFSDNVAKFAVYKYSDNCVEKVKGAPYYKYCLSDNGDKLYTRPSGSNDWRYVGLNTDKTLECKSQLLTYDEINIDTTSDSSTVIRSKGDFKYMIDLHYDMSKINNSTYIRPSGFGTYLESSGMKEVNKDVLYMTTDAWKNRTAATDTAKFDPSMGDGGAAGNASDKKVKGLPGAVFIAW